MPIRTALGGARARLTAATLVLAVAGCLGASAPASAAAGSAALDSQELAACAQINALRAASGLAPLRVSATLTKAATWMSTDMAANDYIGHTDSHGRNPAARIRTFGFHSVATGENLAAGNRNATATFDQWKAEPAHRVNMLRPDYRVIGIGRASAAGSMFRWYWATTFGGAGPEPSVAC